MELNQLIIFSETKSHYVTQAEFQLLDSSNPPASVSQEAETTGLHYHAWKT
jgi:hypothetical protein